MESLFSYCSDDENETAVSDKVNSCEQDVNYDNITMEMSEDSTSNHERGFSPHSGSEESQVSSPPRPAEGAPFSMNESTFSQDGEDKYNNKSYDDHKTREKSQENKRKKYSREDRDKEKDREKEKERDKEKEREKDKEREKEKDRARERDDRHRYRRSRSPSHRYDRSRRSRSPRDRSKYTRRDHSPGRRHRERDRSPRRGCFDRKPSKLSILEKLGIELKLPDGVDKDGSGLPSYYNPVAMNPAKYAEQVAKRKLLWSNANKQDKAGTEVKNENTNAKGSLWQGATFSQDQDGKITAKFQRLMGIKQTPSGGESSGSSESKTGKDLIKKQEELFSSMELQYEVARAATHTQRGVGLGFGVHHYPR